LYQEYLYRTKNYQNYSKSNNWFSSSEKQQSNKVLPFGAGGSTETIWLKEQETSR